ncbi:MAG: FxsA family protein [Candidatus Pelagibacter sp. TMED263]|nr:MAG: FxsA family protein [Candidatus Pelagibacter sp. TMED263]|tara:strand:- start:1325 stop:1750 length:426 start_codon:yes stop_codon:yes gene_type:complete
MNSLFLIFIGIPAVEVFLMIKIGGKIGALNTVFLIFSTAIIGIYFAKLEGIKTIRSGAINLYQNKVPIYEIISGASIAVAALLLIIPGFFTDTIGFLLLIPLTRKVLISFFVKKGNSQENKENTNTLDGEIVEDKDKKDEL